MLSSIECSAEADKREALARKSISAGARQTLMDMAAEWRRLAVLACVQKAWETLNPLTIESPPAPVVDDNPS